MVLHDKGGGLVWGIEDEANCAAIFTCIPSKLSGN